MIDVLIITKNEEANIGFCLDALVGWTSRIFVVDSGSTDGTREIVESHGATFVHHDWPGFAEQKNWALENLPFEQDWVLIIDADEEITEKLRDEIIKITERPVEETKEAGFYINRRQWFLGRQLRFCYYPSWNLRLFKRGMARYEKRRVHEHVLIDGPTGYIKPPMRHWDRRGLHYYLAKHNDYSSLEAQALLEEGTASGSSLTPKLFGNPLQRRRWLKRNIYRWLPMPWAFRFTFMYVFRLGFLDGIMGLRFCLFIATYEMLVKLKLLELLSGERELDAEDTPVPDAGIEQLKQSPYVARPKAVAEIETTSVDDAPVPEAPTASTSTSGPEAPEEIEEFPAVDEPAEELRMGHPSRPFIKRGPGPQSGPDSPIEEVRLARPARRSIRPVGAGKSGYSVVILTLNEQINIAECIASCTGSDDIHVLDSGSTDMTRSIAEKMGATVHENPFETFGKQRNWAIDNIETKYPWLLHLDADERMTPENAKEIEDVLATDPVEAGYYIPSKLIFMGRWLKRAGGYPTFQVRLFHKDRLRFTDYGHGQREQTTGELGRLSEPYLHDAFSKGLDDWLSKHNRYSRQEAEQALVEKSQPILWGSMFGEGPIARRRVLKRIAYRIPFRATLRWWSILLLQGGIFEGRAARNYATLVTTYERMTGIKIRWLEFARRARRERFLDSGGSDEA